MSKKISKYKISDNLYRCECGKEFNNHQSLNAHLSHCDYHHKILGTEKKLRPSEINHSMCWENKSEEEINLIRNKSNNTLKERFKSGELVGYWKDKHLSEEHKQKIREKYVQRQIKNGRISTFNEKACEYIDELNKKNNWHLQHALNGGEVIKFGYWLDGYDKDLNIVFEYDEPKHYIDIENNILNKKDLERQNFLIEKLNCKFFRYNEKTKCFYEVYKDTFIIFDELQLLIDSNLIDFTNKTTIKKSLKENSEYSFRALKLYANTNKELYNKIYKKEIKKEKQKRQIILNKKARDISKIEKQQNKEIIFNKRREILINAVKNSNIDFTKFGWSEKLKKYLIENNLLFSKKILHSLVKYYNEFFEEYKPFLRNGCLYKK